LKLSFEDLYCKLKSNYNELKNQLKAELKAELEAELDVDVGEREFHKHNVLTQKQIQGQEAESESEIKD